MYLSMLLGFCLEELTVRMCRTVANRNSDSLTFFVLEVNRKQY